MSHTDPFDISASASVRGGGAAFNQKPSSRAASSSSRQTWVACGQDAEVPREAEVPRMAIDLGPLSRPEVVINAGSAPTTAGSSELSTGPSLSAATATTNAATAAPTVTVVYAAPPAAASAPPVAPSKAKKANALSALCRPATEDEEMAFVAESDTDAAKAAKKRNSSGICVPLRSDDADDMLATTSRSQPDGAAHSEAAKKTTSKRFPCIALDADADENKQQRSEEGAQVQDGAAASRSCFSATFEGTRAVGSGAAGNDTNSDACAEPPKERTARHRFSAPALCGAPVVPAATATAVAPGDAAGVEGGDAASTTDDLDEAAELRQLQAEQDDPFFCCCGEDIARKDPRLLRSGEKLQTASSTGWIGNPGFGAGGCRAWCSRLHWPSAVYLALMTLASFFITIGIVFPVYQTKAYTASRAAPHEVWTLWMHCTETRLGNAGSLVGQAQGGTHCHTWPEDTWECSDIKSRYNAARVFGVMLILVSLGNIVAGVTHALRIYRFPAGPILLLGASFILTIFTLAATTSIWQINTCDSGARANDPNLRIGEAPYFYMTALLLQVVAVPFVVYMLYFPSARLRAQRDEVDPERGAFTALEQQRRDELKREFPGLINEDVVGREVRVGDYVRQLAAADYVTSAPPTALSVAALGATAPEVLSARDAQPTTRRDSAARTAPTPITSRYLAASPAAAAADAPTSGRPPMPGFSGVVPASATTPQQQLRVL